MSRFDQLKKEISDLVAQGSRIALAWIMVCEPDRVKKTNPKLLKEYDGFNLQEEYQRWYSKVLVVVKQLLPDRKEYV